MSIHYAFAGDHVVVVTIDRPERRNSLDLEHMVELAAAWRRFAADADAWVAVVTGTGENFCAGADLASFFVGEASSAATALAQAGIDTDHPKGNVLFEWLLKGLDVFKPIVAAVDGACMAGGFELLTATDLRVASPRARFALTEPKRGILAGGGSTVRLPRQLPWPAAMELLLTAAPMSAQRALEVGLLNEVVPAEHLLDRALDWARTVADNAPLAVQASKESALRALGAPTLAEAFDLETEIAKRIATTADSIEGTRAFVERRPPIWTGR